jgi:uncharacterized repeat protein (TIGR01451 family)
VRAFDTNRWVGVEGGALLAGGVGVVVRQPGLLLAAVVCIAFVAYARVGDAPDPDLAVERELSDPHADPGDDVTVRVRVRNVGDVTLPDLRLVDGVPPALEVTDGSARHGTALRPGKRATFSYTVTATRGRHEWEPLSVATRNLSGSREREAEATTETVLRSLPTLSATADLPLRGLTTRYTGRVSTDVAGEGVEFYSTREYRPGDPATRVDWNRYARTGEVATLTFREERAATVVLLVDAREEAYLARERDEPNAVELSVDAATRAFTALADSGDRVGVTALSPRDCWLAPSVGDNHRASARELFATHPAFDSTPPSRSTYLTLQMRRLRRRLAPDAQLILFSPLADDAVVRRARELDAVGHLVTVVSPDVTRTDSTGRSLARIERRNRISRLRGAGIRVLDWGEESLATELARAATGWST